MPSRAAGGRGNESDAIMTYDEDPIAEMEKHLRAIRADTGFLEIQLQTEAESRTSFQNRVAHELFNLRYNTGLTFLASLLCFVILCLILWRVW